MSRLIKRLNAIVMTAALIALLVYGYRRSLNSPRSGKDPRGTSGISNQGPAWLGLSQRTRVIGVVSMIVVALAAFPASGSHEPEVHGRSSGLPAVSSRGGFRLPEVGVLGATPPPVPVISKPIGPPSPDPVLLAAARLALTPTPTPRPTPLPGGDKSGGWRREMGVFRVTGYSDSPFLNGTDGRGITKSGVKTHWGAVAVDPGIIPLGTDLVIEGYEGTVFKALDTGGGILGRWIDIWFPTDWDALQHGLRELSVAVVGED